MEVPAQYSVLKYLFDELPIELHEQFLHYGNSCQNPECSEVVESDMNYCFKCGSPGFLFFHTCLGKGKCPHCKQPLPTANIPEDCPKCFIRLPTWWFKHHMHTVLQTLTSPPHVIFVNGIPRTLNKSHNWREEIPKLNQKLEKLR